VNGKIETASPEKGGRVEGPFDHENVPSWFDMDPVTLTLAAGLLLGGFCSWNEKTKFFILGRPLCVPDRVPINVLPADLGCELKVVNELLTEKLIEPCELLQLIPPIVAAKSPLLEENVATNPAVSGVTVLMSPSSRICRLQAARIGTVLCSVTVKVFGLQGHGELCPMLPLKAGPCTPRETPIKEVEGMGIPDPLIEN